MRKAILIIVIVGVMIAFAIIATLPIKPQKSTLEDDELEFYISCGCGCCGFDEPLEKNAKEECLYKSKGESIGDKIKQDKQLTPDLCATAGCTFPIEYVYCD